MVAVILNVARSTMHTLLSGAAQVTNNCRPSGERANPEGGRGVAKEAVNVLDAASKRNTRLAVAQATNNVWPSDVAASAVGER